MKLRMLVLSMFCAQIAHASLFELKGTVANGETTIKGFDTFEDAYNAISESNLQTILIGYTGSEATDITLNLRGMPVYLSYPNNSATTLQFSIPAIGINQTFSGATRDESQKEWVDYLKNNTDLLGKLQKELVKTSPVDPVAGNPNSMMTRTVQMDYDTMLRSHSNSLSTSTGNDNHRFGVGVSASYMKSDATTGIGAAKSTSVTLPLSYNYQFGDANHELYVNMPLTYTTVEKAKVYDGSFSIAYRHPVTENWVLASTLGARVAGSQELASLGSMGSGAMMSSYTFPLDGWQLTAGNMISYYRTLTMKANGNSYDPGIHNTVYRNGLLLVRDSGWALGTDALTWEFALVDTRFKGTDLYNQYQDELSITFGSNRPAHASEADFRGGFTYIKAEKAHGFRLNFGAWF